MLGRVLQEKHYAYLLEQAGSKVDSGRHVVQYNHFLELLRLARNRCLAPSRAIHDLPPEMAIIYDAKCVAAASDTDTFEIQVSPIIPCSPTADPLCIEYGHLPDCGRGGRAMASLQKVTDVKKKGLMRWMHVRSVRILKVWKTYAQSRRSKMI